MNKDELLHLLSQRTGLTTDQCQSVMTNFAELVSGRVLWAGAPAPAEIVYPGLGKFHKVKIGQRVLVACLDNELPMDDKAPCEVTAPPWDCIGACKKPCIW